MGRDIGNTLGAYENEEKFTAEPKGRIVRSSALETDAFVAPTKGDVDSDGGQSYDKIAADMACHTSTICRTIKQDLSYSFHWKSHHMLIT